MSHENTSQDLDHSTVIVDTSASPYAAHGPVPIANVRLREGVLASRMFTNFRESIPTQFHAMEQAQIRQAAGQYRVATGAVIDALDAYLRAHPSPEHKPGASPCKPRPFYD